jgi:peptide/nickel transport system permease protein
LIAIITKKLLYGFSVMWGVVTVVFLIFNLKPGDPAQMLLGQRATEEATRAIEKELGLDLPVTKQYMLYINDLSFLSIHELEDNASHLYLDENKYSGKVLMSIGSRALVLKYPYLRRSYQSKKTVSSIIAEALPGTIVLAGSAILLALLLGGVIGILSALYKDSFFDKSALVIAVLGMSMPSFYVAIIISWIFGFLWYSQTSLPILPVVFAFVFMLVHVLSNKGVRTFKFLAMQFFKGALIGIFLWLLVVGLQKLFGLQFLYSIDKYVNLPGTYLNQSGSLYEIDVFTGPYLSLRNLILPMITLGIRPLAVIIQLLRNSLLDVLSADYIRTARAKGLKLKTIIWRHALKNALNPVITAVSGWFASMLAGAVFIEFVFGWQGLGLRIYEALIKEDFPVVIGAVIVISATFVIINILVDVLYSVLDPRIRLA